MTRESLLIALGILLAITPFLGLPYSWIMVIIPVLSAGVVVIGVTLRKKRSAESSRVEPVAPPPYEAPEA
ncbi:MAG TPA: hypothetical protein VEA92_02840 [Candidatus Paceibacterota bacterium]|nr:hypothetical protein [Candidatus Paceibacterota bacterium]